MKKEIEKIRQIIDEINIGNLGTNFVRQEFSYMDEVEVDNKYYDQNKNNNKYHL